jgi:hypothetical protein
VLVASSGLLSSHRQLPPRLVVMRADAVIGANDDWLYGRTTFHCNSSLTYEGSVQPGDPAARLAMAVFWAASALAVFGMPRQRTASLTVVTFARPHTRWVMLDAVRITAVAGVVTEHSGGSTYSEHNTEFVTMVVLPWLFVVSGVSFMMSKSTARHCDARTRTRTCTHTRPPSLA